MDVNSQVHTSLYLRGGSAELFSEIEAGDMLHLSEGGKQKPVARKCHREAEGRDLAQRQNWDSGEGQFPNCQSNFRS